MASYGIMDMHFKNIMFSHFFALILTKLALGVIYLIAVSYKNPANKSGNCVDVSNTNTDCQT